MGLLLQKEKELFSFELTRSVEQTAVIDVDLDDLMNLSNGFEKEARINSLDDVHITVSFQVSAESLSEFAGSDWESNEDTATDLAVTSVD